MSIAVLRLNVDGTRVACVLVDAAWRGLLNDAGYDWRDYNRIVWPIGASEWASGKLLVSGAGLAALISAGVDDGPFDIEIGSVGNLVTLEGMYALPPEPLFIGGDSTNARLYALPIVCARYQARHRTADANYNLLQRDLQTWQPDTIEGPGDPWSYDQIGSALASDAGLPWSVLSGSAVTARNPTEVRAFGDSAPRWLDSLLAESGRVYVYDIDGTGQAQLIDARDVFDVLTPLAGKIAHGGVRYATGSPPSDIAGVAAPVAAWMTQDVPETVRVIRPSIRQTVQAYNDPWVSASAATYNAASASLAAGDESARDIHDNQYVLDPGAPTSAENARREAVATDYYRRFVAGGLDVFCAGIVAPTFGGSCQRAEWVCDPVGGFRTRLVADPNWHGYGFVCGLGRVRAGDAMQVVRRHDGTEEARVVGDVRHVRGTITALQTVGEAAASTHAYKAESLDGVWTISSFQSPLLRPYNGVPIVAPAEVGSECTIWIDDTAGVPVPYLYACQERLAFEECGGAQFVYGDDDADNSAFWLVSEDGEILVGEGGNILVSEAGDLATHPEDLVLIGNDYDIVFDDPGYAVIAESATENFVSAGHYNDVLATSAYATVTTSGVAVATSAVPGVDPDGGEATA